MELTKTEIRVLRNLHLTGGTGKMGSMSLKQRRELIRGLLAKGLIDERAKLTKKGIEASLPSNIKRQD